MTRLNKLKARLNDILYDVDADIEDSVDEIFDFIMVFEGEMNANSQQFLKTKIRDTLERERSEATMHETSGKVRVIKPKKVS